MTASLATPSPTGRLTQSEPEMQYFPGTPQALAQSRRLKAAVAQNNESLLARDYSALEARVLADYLKSPA